MAKLDMKPRRVTFSDEALKGSKGGKRTVPSGDYKFKVDKCYWGVSSTGNDMLVFESIICKGPHKGFRAWSYCVQTDKAQWKTREMLTACGLKVKKANLVSPREYIGLYHGGTLEDEIYKKKKRSKLAAVFPVSEIGKHEEDQDDDDSEDTESEEDDDDETDSDDVETEEEEDEGDEEDEDEEEEEDKPVGKKKVTKKKEEEEEEVDDDDEEDE